MSGRHFNLRIAVLTAVAAGFMLWVALSHLHIDADIAGSLPTRDPVIAQARSVMEHHPAQDRIVVDVGVTPADTAALLAAGDAAMERMRASGLFAEVGMVDARRRIPELLIHVLDHLPVLYSARALDRQIAPLLTPAAIEKRLAENLATLSGLDGVGRAAHMARDPLGLAGPALSRLRHLAPSDSARIVRGHLVSADGEHLLIVARPAASATDTAYAAKAMAFFDQLRADMAGGPAEMGKGSVDVDKRPAEMGKGSVEMDKRPADSGEGPAEMNKRPAGGAVITPMGAFRAALDNETMARADVQRAILFSMLGIAALLLVSFPRPLIGLLAFVPAVAGTVAALFIHSLFSDRISLLSLGFGGAIISITVDHGIAYLLFLDQEKTTTGESAAHEVWSVGLLATLTTMGAFLSLSFSGFAILGEIGRFAAMGIGFSFIFVHTLFPRIIPSLPPARRPRPIAARVLVELATHPGKRVKAGAALFLAGNLVLLAKPEFRADLRAMNTIRPETRAAEALITRTWGDIFSKVYLMTEAPDREGLIAVSDRVARMLETDTAEKRLKTAFSPAMIFPGPDLARDHLAAWREFWGAGRVDRLERDFAAAAAAVGFAPEAFSEFFKMLRDPQGEVIPMPTAFDSLLGVARDEDGRWVQFSTLTPGSAYDAKRFWDRYARVDGARIFDPVYFAKRLGELLSQTFTRMVLVIGISATILLLAFYRRLRPTLITLLPVAFSMICTLGTLKLLKRPLDIPSLMLSIVVIGMGIDYAIFFVRSHQRYGRLDHPAFSLIRMAVFLASASTLVGFATLCFADHSLLKSAGVASFLGIFYALVGAFAILPAALEPD